MSCYSWSSAKGTVPFYILELIRVINEYKLFVISYSQGRNKDGTVHYGRLTTFCVISDGRCPFDVTYALSREESVRGAFVTNIVPVDAG